MDLPKSVTFIDLTYNDKITGDLKFLPKTVTDISLSYNQRITGDLEDLPKSVTKINLLANRKITGSLDDIRGIKCVGCGTLRSQSLAKPGALAKTSIACSPWC